MVELAEVTVRHAEVTDAAAIAGVHVRSWQEAYAGVVPAEYLDALDPQQRAEQWARHLAAGPADHVVTWVALTGPRVVGFVSVGPARDEDADPHDREVYSLYLDPGTWGHGVARDLVRTALAEVGEHTPVSLWVLAANERARHFYRRHGFQPDGVERYDEIGGAQLLKVRYYRRA